MSRLIGLGMALLAAAVSLSGCTGEAGAGAGQPRGGIPAASVVPPTLPETASLVAVAAVSDVVPPGLAGRSWVVRGPNGRAVAGSLGSGRRLRLPAGERPLAVSAGRLASAVPAASGSVVVVRSIEDGDELARVERPEEVLAAAFAGDLVVLSGHVPGAVGRDPGVVAMSLSDGSVSTLIAPTGVPATVPAAAGADLVRTVAVSPSGRTLVSGLCGADDCAIDVVDLTTHAVRRLTDSAGGLPGALTDEILVVGSPGSDWIAGVDLVTGDRRWTLDAAEFQHAYATDDGRIVQALVDRTGAPVFRLEVIDPATGRGRSVLTRDASDGLTLWPELSDASIAVLGSGTAFADAGAAEGGIHAAVVDLASGRLDGNAVRFDLGPVAP